MSHTMNIKTEIKDMDALKTACDRLGLKTENRNGRLFAVMELPGHSKRRRRACL